jgi:threonine dehydratase
MSGFIEQVQAATQTLTGVVETTPLTFSPALSALSGSRVYLKQENRQVTGCCKARSAFYMASTLSSAQKQGGVVTVSTGNNGIAMAWALAQVGVPGVIFLPRTVTDHKVQAIRRSEVEIIFHGEDIVEAEMAARTYAAQTRSTFLSPYNEWGAIYGQATIAAEVVQQATALGQGIDTMIIPVGGGGLISGIAGYCNASALPVQVIGAQPANSAVMAHSVRAGHILDLSSLPTLSDATAGGVEQGSITFDFCRRLVHDYVLVEESEIAGAIGWLYDEHGIVVEGAGALAVAAFLQRKAAFAGQTVVLLLCGANINPEQFHAIRQSQAQAEPVYA